jgi:hypothetical protein
MTETDPEVQDPEVPPGPRVRLRLVLALLRILAGRRGRARLRWSGQGFIYTLGVHRAAPVAYDLDRDPDAIGGPEVAQRLRDLIGE